jgi:hypothetical protein
LGTGYSPRVDDLAKRRAYYDAFYAELGRVEVTARLQDGREIKIACKSFSRGSYKSASLDKEAYNELKSFAGPDSFDLVTELGARFYGCRFGDARMRVEYDSEADVDFVAQLPVVSVAAERYTLICALDAGAHVKTAEGRTAGETLLRAIEVLTDLATTETQRRKVALIDGEYGRRARMNLGPRLVKPAP